MERYTYFFGDGRAEGLEARPRAEVAAAEPGAPPPPSETNEP